MKECLFKRAVPSSGNSSALSPEDKEKYDESMNVMLDYYATMYVAKIIGMAEGRAEGLEEGIQKCKFDVAKIMLEDGDSIEKIMCTTGLSKDIIEA